MGNDMNKQEHSAIIQGIFLGLVLQILERIPGSNTTTNGRSIK